jgi:DNA-3-methyladenine glycosylase I
VTGPAPGSGTDGRCPWADGSPLLRRYHDLEWGVPSRDERHLFELLVLEGAQAGLSWSTILGKRDRYRERFAGFEPDRVAAFTPDDVESLLDDPGIVRNRRKVLSAVANARALLGVREERGSFADYLWDWVDGVPVVHRPRSSTEVPVSTALSDRLSRDLRRRGFGFVGPTIVYSYLQAAGLVDDHLVGCPSKPVPG